MRRGTNNPFANIIDPPRGIDDDHIMKGTLAPSLSRHFWQQRPDVRPMIVRPGHHARVRSLSS